MRGLYVHIPFCEHICIYCDFCKRVPLKGMIDKYIKRLKKEYQKLENKNFDTIYIGGGTPSMLSYNELKQLLLIFKHNKPLEYTIEVNPESYTHEKGLLFKEFNINRVSVGVQTFNETILNKLNRKHCNEDVFYLIDDLNNIGITNISLDLMFALPNQTMDDVVNDLNIIKKLKIKHLSYYSLILEEKTVLYNMYLKGEFKENELETDMYVYIINELVKYGFNHYEVSNFSITEKYESIHNKLYWNLSPYEAIGAGSHGFDGVNRYYYDSNITNYINQEPVKHLNKQTTDVLLGDFIIFSLRMLKGVNLLEVSNKFNVNVLTHYNEVNEFINDGFLELKDNYLKVTKKGLMFLNRIELIFV